MELSTKTTMGIRTLKRSRTCSVRMCDSKGAGFWLCCWDKGGNKKYPEHQIRRKVTALNSYTVRTINIIKWALRCSKFSWTAYALTITYWCPDSLSNSRSLYEDLATGCSKLQLRHSCWQPPQPAEPWSGVLDATKEAPICVQRGMFPTEPEISGQEDCLYLNVYTPRVKWSQDGLHYCIIFLPRISIVK